MADERDPRVSARYRELGAEEPPRALDDAILAASRRAIDSRPAPLVAPTGRRRWYFPVAAAAIITLAVAVTVQVERQQPDAELVVAARAPAPAPVQQKEELALKDEKALRSAPAPKQAKQPPREAAGPAARGFTPDPAPAASAPAPAAPAPQTADAPRDLAKSQQRNDVAETRRMESEMQVQRAPAPSAGTAARAPAPAPQAKPAPDPSAAVLFGMRGADMPPERQLELIVELRKQGRHEEADRALAEFRKRYPDYRLSDEMRAKVERPQ